MINWTFNKKTNKQTNKTKPLTVERAGIDFNRTKRLITDDYYPYTPYLWKNHYFLLTSMVVNISVPIRLLFQSELSSHNSHRGSNFLPGYYYSPDNFPDMPSTYRHNKNLKRAASSPDL